MTDIVITAKDVVVEVEQPTAPPNAVPPPKVGLVEINQIVQRGSIWFTGSGPPTLNGGQFGDLYLDVDTGDIYRWDGDSWEFQGTFAPSTDTPAEVLEKLLQVDGAGSLLDADFFDGHDSPYFATQAGLDANTAHDTVQDTNIANNAAAITQNTSDISANAGEIATIKTKNTSQDTAIAGKVSKTGDTMTGPLTVVTPPVAPTDAASKAYVDAQAGAATTPPATATPLMDGTGAVGTATKYAREDHRHPSDTTKLGDAPNDANAYGRKAAAWVDVTEEAPADGLGYMRKNGAWTPSTGGAYTDDAPPPPPLQDGQLWWKSSSGVLYLYYVEPGDTVGQWVEAAAPAGASLSYVLKTARRSNLVINGALTVSQENGNTEGTTAGYYAADQMCGTIVASGAAFGFGIVTASNPSGSKWRLRYRVTTAKASLAAGDIAGFFTRLEGFNVQDLGWSNTATQKDAVLQFGFNGPAGTYCVGVRNFSAGNTTHSFVASFTITAGQANTDTQQVIKVPAPGAMTAWAMDNTCAIELWFALASGSTFLAPAAGWNSGNFVGVTGMSNGLAAVQSFQVWDIGFHADPDKTGLAPVFEVPDYGTELAKCQRYWAKIGVTWQGSVTSGNSYAVNCYLPVTPRLNPTCTGVNAGGGSFPAAAGTIASAGYNGIQESRVANATAASGYYSTVISANARM